MLGPYSDGWLEHCGNAVPRKIVALNDRTRLTDPLVFLLITKRTITLEDIYVGGNKPRRDNIGDTAPIETEDIYITPRSTHEDIYISRNRQTESYADYDLDEFESDNYENIPDEEDPEPEEPPKKKKKRKSKLFRTVRAVVLLVILLAGMGTALVYHTFSSVNYTETGHKDNVFLDSDTLIQSASVKNILLIGVDRRNPDDTSRSDTMLMVSINTATKKIKLTSFMRDSYVYIPEKKKSAKLNAACTWGGAQMVMDTIEYNFNVEIDHYMLVDFSMFESIVDGLGGVTVEITEKEAKYMRDAVHLTNIKAGEAVHLNGKEALWYCRIRKLDSDFMRTERQRKVMTAIIDNCKSTSPAKLYEIVGDVLSRVETDMSPASLTGLAINGLFRYLHYDIEQGSVPAEGTWKSKSVSGQSVLSLDLGANIAYLKEFIYEE